MKKHTVIHIDTAEFHNAVYILGREEKIYNWNQNVEFRKRLVGLLGEIAAAKHLNNIYGRHRIIIPMGVNARTGVSVNAFGKGDIMTISRTGTRERQTHVYEVKSTEGIGKQLPTIRQDNAESYVMNGVDAIILVAVHINKAKAECRIMQQVSPVEVIEKWRPMVNRYGQECYAFN